MAAIRSLRSWVLAPWWLFVFLPATAWPWSDIPGLHDPVTIPDGIHVLDGSYVLDRGRLHVNVTNHGLIGSLFQSDFPFSNAPSAQWPGGSGHEYMWAGGLWVGGIVHGERAVTTGQYQRELRPGDHLRDTIYEAIGNRQERPTYFPQITGRRLPQPGADDDGDGVYDDDWMNGLDDDGDGQIDEDFGQIGDQMFTCVMHDDLPLIRELYPDHNPLGISVIQRTACWEDPEYLDVVALDYQIVNSGTETLDGVYLGFFADFEIQELDSYGQPDDLAGFFSGAVRADNGIFYRVNMAYALDGAEEDPLPGCIGLLHLHHDTDFRDVDAPHVQEVNSFQIFTAGGQVNQGGEPTMDEDRYLLMERAQHDANLRPNEAADVKVLISSGPFNNFEPQEVLNYQLALVMGDGLDGALQTASKAVQMGYGAYYDYDHDWASGQWGRETKVCVQDYPESWHGESILFSYRYMIMDEQCAGDWAVFGWEMVNGEEMFVDEDGKYCIWVNADNCDECFRALGVECTLENNLFWRTYGGMNFSVMTGLRGREHRLPWVIPRPVPPVSPNVRVVPGDRQVEIFWDDLSEHVPDPNTGMLDFESYEVWEATHWLRPQGVDAAQAPPARQWSLIERMDLVNTVPGGAGFSPNDLPLGENTGLEDWIYTPPCLSDARFTGLDTVMRVFVEADVYGQHLIMPDLRDFRGEVVPGMESFIPWETYPDVLDTFFAVTPRVTEPGSGGLDKRATRYYHLLREELDNGFPMHVSVTATDHTYTYDEEENLVISGLGAAGEPANNPVPVTPRPEAQTPEHRREWGNNIYVYPNPATREALAEFDGQYPTHDDPTGVRIAFSNLPEAHNTIRIFTAAGDLVETIEHDGYSQGGQAYWNLMSRNGQEVVSGIYLYAVHSDRAGFDDFRGRFVIIR